MSLLLFGSQCARWVTVPHSPTLFHVRHVRCTASHGYGAHCNKAIEKTCLNARSRLQNHVQWGRLILVLRLCPRYVVSMPVTLHHVTTSPRTCVVSPYKRPIEPATWHAISTSFSNGAKMRGRCGVRQVVHSLPSVRKKIKCMYHFIIMYVLHTFRIRCTVGKLST